MIKTKFFLRILNIKHILNIFELDQQSSLNLPPGLGEIGEKNDPKQYVPKDIVQYSFNPVPLHESNLFSPWTKTMLPDQNDT